MHLPPGSIPEWRFMMRKILLLVLVLVLAVAPLAAAEVFYEPRLYAGAAAIFGTSAVDFSFGGGLRTWVYFDKTPGSDTSYGTCFDVEYNRRGGSLPLDYIDITAMAVVGRGIFLAAGSYFAFCIDKHGLGEDAGFFDMGGAVSFGYQFPGEGNRFVLAANVKAGLLDVYNWSSGITWGMTFGIMF